MNRSTPSASDLLTAPTIGLPEVKYRTPVIATLLASFFLLAVAALLGFLGVLNTITQWGKASTNEEGASFIGAGLCGLLSLVALAGVVYFLLAVRMGVQDLGENFIYSRGVVMKPRALSGRRGRDWLLMSLEYVGTDRAEASRVSDEQRASSVDRSQIFQPRFATGSVRPVGAEEDQEAAGTAAKSYLSPDRISSSQEAEPFKLDPEGEEDPDGPRAVFRIDFAPNAKLVPGEEVLVAHSRRLQHIYYVARLRNGEWEAYRNKKLI